MTLAGYLKGNLHLLPCGEPLAQPTPVYRYLLQLSLEALWAFSWFLSSSRRCCHLPPPQHPPFLQESCDVAVSSLASSAPAHRPLLHSPLSSFLLLPRVHAQGSAPRPPGRLPRAVRLLPWAGPPAASAAAEPSPAAAAAPAGPEPAPAPRSPPLLPHT